MNEEAERSSVGEEAVEQTGERASEETAEQAVGRTSEETAEQAVGRTAEEAAEETAKQGAEPVAKMAPESDAGEQQALARVIEALLFLSSDPVPLADLAEAAEVGEEAAAAAIELLGERLSPGESGLQLREVGGGYLLASAPEAEDAARRLFSKPRIATLTPAQTETLAIVAYLQPISRPEIGRIRGVSADSAAAALLERGLIEESGRSQFGAALYKTTAMFLKLFGLRSLQELPDAAKWDPSPEEQTELRDRLLRAGEARSGGALTDE